jgi:hypothetical protein
MACALRRRPDFAAGDTDIFQRMIAEGEKLSSGPLRAPISGKGASACLSEADRPVIDT